MFMKSRVVFDEMKEIQKTRALAQTSLFPNLKREDLSAMQLLVLSDNSQPNLEFKADSAKKPAVCKPLNLSTLTPQSIEVSSERKDADTVDTQIAGMPKRQVNNEAGSTVSSTRRGRKRNLQYLTIGCEEARMRKVCKDLYARFSAGSKRLLSEEQVQKKLFPRREIVATDSGKAIVRINPETNDSRGPAFSSRIDIQDGVTYPVHPSYAKVSEINIAGNSAFNHGSRFFNYLEDCRRFDKVLRFAKPMFTTALYEGDETYDKIHRTLLIWHNETNEGDVVPEDNETNEGDVVPEGNESV
jgi:hypothetical protein